MYVCTYVSLFGWMDGWYAYNPMVALPNVSETVEFQGELLRSSRWGRECTHNNGYIMVIYIYYIYNGYIINDG